MKITAKVKNIKIGSDIWTDYKLEEIDISVEYSAEEIISICTSLPKLAKHLAEVISSLES